MKPYQHEQLIDTIRHRLKVLGGDLLDTPGFLAYDLGGPENDTHLRGITINPEFSPKDEAGLLKELARQEKDVRPAWSVRVHPAAKTTVQAILEKEGYRLTEAKGYPIMERRDPIIWEAKHPVNLVGKEEGAAVLKKLAPLLADVFSLEYKTATALLSPKLWLTDPFNRIAYIEGQEGPLCLGMLCRNPKQPYAGLYYIATSSARRGEGLAKDLVARLSEEAFQNGAKSIVLQASSLGEFVYRRLGYEEVGRYLNFVRDTSLKS